ncbi:DUF6191 domain-containing protein [Streptomyces sp. M10(2022)]
MAKPHRIRLAVNHERQEGRYMLGTGIAVAALVLFLIMGVLSLRWLRSRMRKSSGNSGNFEFLEVFAPSQRHASEEIQRQRLTKEEDGDGAPPLDLDTGRAHIVIRKPSNNEKRNY